MAAVQYQNANAVVGPWRQLLSQMIPFDLCSSLHVVLQVLQRLRLGSQALLGENDDRGSCCRGVCGDGGVDDR